MNISVIIPLYNVEKYIAKALDSCIALAEVKEIIVVDDGYRDHAKEIVKAYQTKYPAIKLFEHPKNENLGAGASRNLGIEKATQEYIAFLDADDFYLANRFEKDKDVFARHSDADGCYNAIEAYFYSEKAKQQFTQHFRQGLTTVTSKSNPTPANLFRGLLGMISGYGYFHLNGLTVRKETLVKNQLFFNTSLSVHQDTDFIFKLAFQSILYPSQIDKAVAMRGVHEENRITANYRQEREKRVYKRYLMWESLYEWVKARDVNRDARGFIYNELVSYRLLHSGTGRLFLREFFVNPTIFFHRQYVSLHKHFFGVRGISYLFLKGRNIIFRLFVKLGFIAR